MVVTKIVRQDRMPLRYATKADKEILFSVSCAKEAVLGNGKKYEEVEAKMNAEKARLYPNEEYIARCEKILQRLSESYEKYLEWQKSHGIIR